VCNPSLVGHGTTLFAGLRRRGTSEEGVDLKLVSRLECGGGGGDAVF